MHTHNHIHTYTYTHTSTHTHTYTQSGLLAQEYSFVDDNKDGVISLVSLVYLVHIKPLYAPAATDKTHKTLSLLQFQDEFRSASNAVAEVCLHVCVLHAYLLCVACLCACAGVCVKKMMSGTLSPAC